VFVADVHVPALDDSDHHHLERVLRLRPGDPLTVSDGAGRWRTARFGDEVEVDGAVVECPPVAVPLTICFALVKGERPELVVQKLTELGVDRIVPFVAARSVVRWDPTKAAREAGRLRAIARAAAMQSRRCWLPAVEEIADFAAVAAQPGAARADRGGDPPDLARPTVLVGPEGGWSDEERGIPLPVVGLGDHVLRAETAAITAAALLAALRSGLVAPPG
jgi:16S rRNA (uracil1498-N3)-methyltransferase